jgi:hypothetical protein
MFLIEYMDKPLVLLGFQGDTLTFENTQQAHDFIQKQGLNTWDFEYQYRYEQWPEIHA